MPPRDPLGMIMLHRLIIVDSLSLDNSSWAACKGAWYVPVQFFLCGLPGRLQSIYYMHLFSDWPQKSEICPQLSITSS
uniref:Uncharacterized protein MANES_S090300 n=1 Tax=Rhizophora mucronata TaxID=61149 RepID=A0A2P2L8G8_RHIMU